MHTTGLGDCDRNWISKMNHTILNTNIYHLENIMFKWLHLKHTHKGPFYHIQIKVLNYIVKKKISTFIRAGKKSYLSEKSD